jgi:hypothetical protein
VAEKHARKPTRQKDEDDSFAPPDKAKNCKQTNEALAITEDVLDDIDRLLKKACDVGDGESISDDEFAARANVFVLGYQQQGGQ